MTLDSRLDDIMGLELLLDLPPGSHHGPPRHRTAPDPNKGEIIGRFQIDFQTFVITRITDIIGDSGDALDIILPKDEDAQS